MVVTPLPVSVRHMTDPRSNQLIWYATRRADCLGVAVDLTDTLDAPTTPPDAGTLETRIARLPQRWALRVHPNVLSDHINATTAILATTQTLLAQPGHDALQPMSATLEQELDLYQQAINVRANLPQEVRDTLDDLADPDPLNEPPATPIPLLAGLDTDLLRHWHQTWETILADLVETLGDNPNKNTTETKTVTGRLEDLETGLEGLRTQLRAAASALKTTTR